VSSNDKTYEIKSGGRPSGNPAKYTFEEVQSLLEATDPSKVSSAGTAFHSAAQAAAHVAHALYLAGSHLSEKWEGVDADAAQKALGQLYATANELYGRSNQAGQALQFYGGTLSQYKGLKFPGGGASPVEDPARQKAAETVMRAVNEHMGTAWDAMPDKVQQNLPSLGRDVGEEKYKSAPNPARTPSGAGSAGGVGGSSGHVPMPHLPRGGPDFTSGQGSQLAGMPTGGGGLGTAPPLATSPLTPGGGNPLVPTGPSGGLGGALPLGPVGLPSTRLGPGGVPQEKLSPPGLSRETPARGAVTSEELEASQAARGGMLGGQGASSGAGAQEVERERSTWLPEEEETWAAEHAAPEVLGSAPGIGTSAGESELERTVWLGEDPDVWTNGETYTTGTIGDEGPRVDEPKAAEEVVEPDILDPERLQEMLDAIATPPEENNDVDVPAPADAFAGLLEGLDTDEVSEIERLLNG
jgi:hypothetical protein